MNKQAGVTMVVAFARDVKHQSASQLATGW